MSLACMCGVCVLYGCVCVCSVYGVNVDVWLYGVNVDVWGVYV